MNTEKNPTLRVYRKAFQAEGPIGAKILCGEKLGILGIEGPCGWSVIVMDRLVDKLRELSRG